MTVEEYLMNYGVLGVWTAYLIYEKNKILAKFSDVINLNTKMLREIKRAICK